MDTIFKILGWTFGQVERFGHFTAYLSKLFSGEISFKNIFSGLLVAFQLFNAACWKTPVKPYGEMIDLTGYTLTFVDEFDGDSLNTDAWQLRANGPRRSGYNATSQAKIANGKLSLVGEYLENGEYGAGWYAGAISLKENYKYGYYEIKCKNNSGSDFWSAFWLQSNHSYDTLSDGGRNGAEIDIFEAAAYNETDKNKKNSVTQTIYCNGVDDNPDDYEKMQFSAIGNNIFEEYNTYGLLWTEDEYIFYINGQETGRSSFGLGTCRTPLEVIVSLEIPENNISDNHSKDYKTSFDVEYVKIYQKLSDN